MYKNHLINIVIPAYNEERFIGEVISTTPEFIDKMSLVDDCSTDATADISAKSPGVTCLRNETNAGFSASCNRGAEKARGKFLVFLNNDTTVTAGWLTELRETFELEPHAGLVGSKLIFPDGRLQEAGGVIWNDGS
jgi:GT2 family glycosyltransferase